jgi:hypothetical protein
MTDASFHDDCWAAARAEGQQEYERRIRAEGMDAMLSPYLIKLDEGPWLPDDSEAPQEMPESVGGQRLS